MNLKRPNIYLDTSIIGGYYDQEFQKYSQKLFDLIQKKAFLGFYSELVIDEIQALKTKDKKSALLELTKPLTQLSINTEIEELANQYLQEGILTNKSLLDCLHIATATVHNMDVIVSWNFKHIVNIRRIPLFNAVNLKLGYKQLQINSPQEVIFAFDNE